MMELPVFGLEDYLVLTGRLRMQQEKTAAGNGWVEKDGSGTAAAEKTELSSPLKKQCEKLASCLKETGALVIRDPRFTAVDNDAFLDMIEKFWGQTEEFKRKQVRLDAHYQVGVQPEGTETPRFVFDEKLQGRMLKLSKDDRPLIPSGADPKWRFTWRTGPRLAVTRFHVYYF